MVEITYVPDIATDGSESGLFGLAQDVTERRTAEEALRNSEARRRLCGRAQQGQHIAQIGSWEHDIESRKEKWSDQNYRIYGHKPGAFEPTYDDWLQHIHPDDLDRVKLVYEILWRRTESTIPNFVSSGRTAPSES